MCVSVCLCMCVYLAKIYPESPGNARQYSCQQWREVTWHDVSWCDVTWCNNNFYNCWSKKINLHSHYFYDVMLKNNSIIMSTYDFSIKSVLGYLEWKVLYSGRGPNMFFFYIYESSLILVYLLLFCTFPHVSIIPLDLATCHVDVDQVIRMVEGP